MNDCFICRKHKGQEATPPGGYLYEDKHWRVCHAPPNAGPLGTLLIESNRHFLDYTDMTEEESASIGVVVSKIYQALREHTDAERIYQMTLIEGVPHFHSWFIPRRRGVEERSLKFLTREDTCEEKDAVDLVKKLLAEMKH